MENNIFFLKILLHASILPLNMIMRGKILISMFQREMHLFCIMLLFLSVINKGGAFAKGGVLDTDFQKQWSGELNPTECSNPSGQFWRRKSVEKRKNNSMFVDKASKF